MAVLTKQTIPQDDTGLQLTYESAASGGDTIVGNNAGYRILAVNNGGGSAITVTIANQKVPDGGKATTVLDMVVSVPAGEIRLIKIGGATSRFVDSSGNINITYSGVTSVTVRALEIVL